MQWAGKWGVQGKKFCTSGLFGSKSAVVHVGLMWTPSGENVVSCDAPTMEPVEAADTDGEYNGSVLRGDDSVVRGRREAAAESSRGARSSGVAL